MADRKAALKYHCDFCGAKPGEECVNIFTSKPRMGHALCSNRASAKRTEPVPMSPDRTLLIGKSQTSL